MSFVVSGGSGEGQRTIHVSDCCPAVMQKRSIWKIDQFHLIRKLGSGYASTVYLSQCKDSGHQVAIKLYHKAKLSELNQFQVSREISIHSRLNHKNIIQLWAAFEDRTGIYLVTEFAAKGDVFADVEKRGGNMSEAETVVQVIHPFLKALTYLHENSIMHRDIKPENLLLSSAGVLKVADFGLSIDFSTEKPVTRVGTLDYMAPEVISCPDKRKPNDHKDMKHLYYTPVIDAWAVGVLAYELLVGRAPFDKGHKKLTIQEIMTAEPNIPLSISDDGRDFIRWSLIKDKHKRPTVQMMLSHPWIMTHVNKALPKAIGNLNRFFQRSDSSVELRSLGMHQEATALAGHKEESSVMEEATQDLQLQAMRRDLCGLQQSNSLSAVEMLRWGRGEGCS